MMHHEHDPVPKLIEAIWQKLPGKATQQALAVRLSTRTVKITQEQISRWKRGQEPKQKAYQRLLEVAREVGAVTEEMSSEDVAEAMPSSPRPVTVKLKGYVGAGAQAHFYSVDEQDLESVDAPIHADQTTVAVEVKGSSLGPILNGWLVYYSDVRSPVTPDLLGRLCVVALADDRILVKRLQMGRRGRFNLESNDRNEPVIENVEVRWAARVTGLAPRA